MRLTFCVGLLLVAACGGCEQTSLRPVEETGIHLELVKPGSALGVASYAGPPARLQGCGSYRMKLALLCVDSLEATTRTGRTGPRSAVPCKLEMRPGEEGENGPFALVVADFSNAQDSVTVTGSILYAGHKFYLKVYYRHLKIGDSNPFWSLQYLYLSLEPEPSY